MSHRWHCVYRNKGTKHTTNWKCEGRGRVGRGEEGGRGGEGVKANLQPPAHQPQPQCTHTKMPCTHCHKNTHTHTATHNENVRTKSMYKNGIKEGIEGTKSKGQKVNAQSGKLSKNCLCRKWEWNVRVYRSFNIRVFSSCPCLPWVMCSVKEQFCRPSGGEKSGIWYKR